MTVLKKGVYRTRAGSRVEISGEHAGIFEIDFDWCEEKACVESGRNVVVDNINGLLLWHCDCCGDGQTELLPAEVRSDSAVS